MKSCNALIALLGATLLQPILARSVLKRSDPVTTDPNDDDFYTQWANISLYKPGDVLKSRDTVTTIGENVSSSIQIKYRTTDGQGKNVSTVATLWIPKNPRNPPAIFAYQYAEDALNLDCAPSWAWVKRSGSNNTGPALIEGPVVIPQALGRGYYVIQPDAEGPASTWLVGNMEGRAVLDAIRATINQNKLDKTTSQAAMYGYSGGAHSTVWAASLAATYAPELNIVGAAYGGTPVDLISTYNILNGGRQAILAGGAIFGLAQGYPALEAYIQSPSGLKNKTIATLFRSRNYCLNNETKNWAQTNFTTLFNSPLLSNPTVLSVTNRESLLSNVSSISVPVPKFPRYQYHSTNDTTVPFDPAKAYVDQQCGKGANIRFSTFPGNHATAAVSGIEPALGFIAQAFNNNTATCVCGTNNCDRGLDS